jgi:hypothetical protein
MGSARQPARKWVPGWSTEETTATIEKTTATTQKKQQPRRNTKEITKALVASPLCNLRVLGGEAFASVLL